MNREPYPPTPSVNLHIKSTADVRFEGKDHPNLLIMKKPVGCVDDKGTISFPGKPILESLKKIAHNYPLEVQEVNENGKQVTIIIDHSNPLHCLQIVLDEDYEDNDAVKESAQAMAISVTHSTNYYPAMLDMLKKLEWSGSDSKMFETGLCTICGVHEDYGKKHRPDCPLDKLLSKLTVSR